MAAEQPTSSRETLILFARPPLPGRAKTRLIPLLGEAGAAALYRAFLADAAAAARAVRESRPTVGLAGEWAAERATDSAPPHESPLASWLPGPFLHRAQTGSNLGARMAAALGRRLVSGGKAPGGHAVLIGTDFPDLPPEIPLAAFEALERMERESSKDTPCAVLGPSSDGGYYLIGLNRPAPAAFSGVEWGTDRVFETTLQKLKALSIPFHTLPEWHDVDDADDLAALRARLDGQPENVAPNTRAALR